MPGYIVYWQRVKRDISSVPFQLFQYFLGCLLISRPDTYIGSFVFAFGFKVVRLMRAREDLYYK